jgi:hypothetical protein
VVGTAAAGVKDSLFISGNSRDFRRRGEPERPEGEAGLDVDGDILLALVGGIGTLKFGFLPERVLSGFRGDPLPLPLPCPWP